MIEALRWTCSEVLIWTWGEISIQGCSELLTRSWQALICLTGVEIVHQLLVIEIRTDSGREIKRSVGIRCVTISRWIENVACRTPLGRWRKAEVSHFGVLNSLQDMRAWKGVLRHETSTEEMKMCYVMER